MVREVEFVCRGRGAAVRRSAAAAFEVQVSKTAEGLRDMAAAAGWRLLHDLQGKGKRERFWATTAWRSELLVVGRKLGQPMLCLEVALTSATSNVMS